MIKREYPRPRHVESYDCFLEFKKLCLIHGCPVTPHHVLVNQHNIAEKVWNHFHDIMEAIPGTYLFQYDQKQSGLSKHSFNLLQWILPGFEYLGKGWWWRIDNTIDLMPAKPAENNEYLSKLLIELGGDL
jgi:hypothetical protein